jgi:hypothetical protein
MSKWAPIVHGRTLYVDYRPNLIVVPEGFTQREIEWAQKHILATTPWLDFSQRPLWSVFTGERYGIAGVTCWASDVSADMTHDEGQRRRLYVFLGYAAALPLPGLPPLELAAFAPLYDFVRKRWLERDYDSRDLHPHPFTLEPPLIETEGETAKLNGEIRKAAVWPVSEDERLWRAAGRERTVSLCLGLTRSQEVLKSPFLNATAQDVHQPRVLLRPQEQPAAPHPERRRLPDPEERERRRDPYAGQGSAADRDPVAPSVGLIGFFLMLLIAALRLFFPASEERPPRHSEPRDLPPGFRRPGGGERKREEESWDGWR